MFTKKETPMEKLSENKFWLFIRKNIISVAMGLIVVIMLINPDAKSWVLRQFMLTGLFNVSIDQDKGDKLNPSITNFDFEDQTGRIQNTSSLREKVVFINFWASWCPPCRAEFPAIETLYSQFKNNPDIFFLMINEDNDLSAAYDFLKKEKYAIPFFKTKGNVPEEIYTGTLPTTLVLDKKGKIRLRHEGFANYGSEKFIKQLEELMKE